MSIRGNAAGVACFWLAQTTCLYIDRYFWMDDLFSLLYAIDNRTRSAWSRPACVHHTRSANLVGGGPWGLLKNTTRDALLNDPPYFLKLSLKSLPRGTRRCLNGGSISCQKSTFEECVAEAGEQCKLVSQTAGGVVLLAGKLGWLPSRPRVERQVEQYPWNRPPCLGSNCLCQSDAECALKATSCSNTSRHCIPSTTAANVLLSGAFTATRVAPSAMAGLGRV